MKERLDREFARAWRFHEHEFRHHAFRKAPSGYISRHPCQGKFNDEDLLAETRVQTWESISREGMPPNFVAYVKTRFNWLHATEYKRFMRDRAAFEKRFGTVRIDVVENDTSPAMED